MTPLFRIKPLGMILLAAVGPTALTGGLTIWVRSLYLQNHSLGALDPVYYSFYNARLYTRLAYEDRFTLAVQEWLNNARHPLRTIPLLLFAPSWLAQRMGHMATTLPMLLSCLVLLGWTVYRRTKHVSYALSGMALFCAIPGMYWGDGLAVYWLDLGTALLVGSSVFCVVNSNGARDLRWLSAFAVFASLAALSRYVAAGFTFLIAGPLLGYYLARRWWQERSITRAVLQPVALVGAMIGAIAGYFIVAHFQTNMVFYSSYGYGVWQDITAVESFQSVIAGLVSFLPWRMLYVLGAILVVNLMLLQTNNEWDWESIAISAWLAISVVFSLSVILHTWGDRHAVLNAVPLVTFASLSPAPLRDSRNARWRLLLAGAIALAALAIMTLSVSESYRVAVNPSAMTRQRKSFDVALATALQNESRPVVWNMYFDEYAWIPTMEAFYQSGILPLPAGQPFFNVHLSAWRGDYPDLSPDEVNRRVYDASVKWVDIAIVLADPQQEMPWLNNEYSRAVAKHMSTQIPLDPTWQKIFELNSPYGNVAGYRNLSSGDTRYKLALYGSEEIRP